jgi:hypothetical protein
MSSNRRVTFADLVAAKLPEKTPEQASVLAPVRRTPNKEKLLKENNKKENALTLDTKSCPDCQGSGFWYPEGVEKGVAKCKHKRLKEGK